MFLSFLNRLMMKNDSRSSRDHRKAAITVFAILLVFANTYSQASLTGVEEGAEVLARQLENSLNVIPSLAGVVGTDLKDVARTLTNGLAKIAHESARDGNDMLLKVLSALDQFANAFSGNLGLASQAAASASPQLAEGMVRSVSELRNLLTDCTHALNIELRIASNDIKNLTVETRSKVIEGLNSIGQSLSTVFEKHAGEATGVLQAGYEEMSGVAKSFAKDMQDLKAHVTSESFGDSMLKKLNLFVQHSFQVIANNDELKKMTNMIEYGGRVAVVTMLYCLFFAYLIVSLAVYSKYRHHTAQEKRVVIGMLVAGFAILVSLVMVMAPTDGLYPAPRLAGVYRLFRRAVADDPDSDLILNHDAVNAIRSITGPIWVLSESGVYNTGKSTTMQIYLSLLCRLQAVFLARRPGMWSADRGLTDGITMVIVPRLDVDVNDLPTRAKQAYKSMHGSTTAGTFIFLDVQGTLATNSKDSMSNFLELIAILLSTHHTFARSDSVYDTNTLHQLAQQASMISLVEKLSKPSADCLGYKGVNTAIASMPTFGVRVKSGITNNYMSLVQCVKMDNSYQTVLDIPENCSLFIPVISQEHIRLLPEGTQSLLIKYFGHSKALIQPPAISNERELMAALQTDGIDAVGPVKTLSQSGNFGIFNSLAEHQLVELFSSSPKSIDGRLMNGNDLADFLETNFVALTMLLRTNDKLFAAKTVDSSQEVIQSIMLDIAMKQLNDSTREISDMMPLTVDDVGCTFSHNVSELCPPYIVHQQFDKVQHATRSSFCAFESLLDEQHRVEFWKQLNMMSSAKERNLLDAQRETCVFKWSEGQWSECNGTCPGIQRRQAKCVNIKGDTRADVCCLAALGKPAVIEQPCEQPQYTWDWALNKDWVDYCENPTHCQLAAHATLGHGERLNGGHNVRHSVCMRCPSTPLVEQRPDGECMEHKGPKPADQARRCFNNTFYTFGQWTPEICLCRTNQKRDILCQTCYNETIEMSKCQARAINTLPDQTRVCVGYEWVTDGWTQCSGECGTKTQTFVCKSCSGVIVADGQCGVHAKPVAKTEPCDQRYYYKIDHWPADCACSHKVTPIFACINRCDNTDAPSTMCATEQTPDPNCMCDACPKIRGECTGCCGMQFWCDASYNWEPDYSKRHPTPERCDGIPKPQPPRKRWWFL